MSDRDRNIEDAAKVLAALRDAGDRWLDVLALVCDAAIRYADQTGLVAPGSRP